ncbi:transcriptional regulator [Sphingobacteriaceae bacterium]|nr:transcriptional regulator [Sphingobacteriaceae bacterium]
MIGYKLKSLRESKGHSQEYMAIHCNIEQSSYSRLESGIIKPDFIKLRVIAKILDLDFHALIDEMAKDSA